MNTIIGPKMNVYCLSLNEWHTITLFTPKIVCGIFKIIKAGEIVLLHREVTLCHFISTDGNINEDMNVFMINKMKNTEYHTPTEKS